MRDMLDREWNRKAKPAVAVAERIVDEPAIGVRAEEPSTPETPRTLRQKLAAGEFAVSVELDPPRGLNPRKALEGAAMLKAAGVDAINIGDSPMASRHVRRGACGAHATARRRRDDHPLHVPGPKPDGNPVGSSGRPRAGHPQRHRAYRRPAVGWGVRARHWCLGCGLDRLHPHHQDAEQRDGLVATASARARTAAWRAPHRPTADNVDLELDRVRRKIEAGADVLMTQQFYDASSLESFLERLGPIDIPVLIGVMPLQSHKHTEFIHNELAGVFVPEDVRVRMRDAGENGVAEGLAQARELLEQCRPMCDGAYLVPSFGRYEVVGELVQFAKSL